MSPLQYLKQALRPARAGDAAAPVKLCVEGLGERILPSITFGQYGDGTYAYNSNTGVWSFLTPNHASVLTEGSDGVLFGSYDTPSVQGTWEYNYWTGNWSFLTPETATQLSAATDNALFGSFTSGGSNTGTWEYSPWGTWAQLTWRNALQLTGVRDQYFYGTYRDGADGTWQYKDGSWNIITGEVANAISATSSGVLFASYPATSVSAGTWRFNGSWWDQYYTAATANLLAAINDNTFYVQYGNDTYIYTGEWSWLGSGVATTMTTSHSSQLIVSYAGQGTWVYNGYWTQITYADAGALA